MGVSVRVYANASVVMPVKTCVCVNMMNLIRTRQLTTLAENESCIRMCIPSPNYYNICRVCASIYIVCASVAKMALDKYMVGI